MNAAMIRKSSRKDVTVILEFLPPHHILPADAGGDLGQKSNMPAFLVSGTTTSSYVGAVS